MENSTKGRVVARMLRCFFKTAVFLFFVHSVFAEEPYEIRRKNQSLNVGMVYLTDNLDPLPAFRFEEGMLFQNLYRPLIRQSDQGVFEPDLALSWYISPDGKSCTFNLDPEAHFEDGTPILASDVAWSLSRHFWSGPNMNNEGDLSGTLEGSDSVKSGEIVSGIQLLDDHTLKFKFKRAIRSFFHFLSNSELGVLPKNRFNGKYPIASGNVRAKYNPDDRYWLLSREEEREGALSKLQNIRVSQVQDAADAQKRIENGELDVVFGLTSSEMRKMRLPDDFALKTLGLGSYDHLFYNMDRPVFANLEFRRDLSHLVQTAIRGFKDDGITRLLHTYLWEKLMLFNYYKRSFVEMYPEAFKAKWPEPQTLNVLLKRDFLDEAAADHLTETLKKAGITLNWSHKKTLKYNESFKNRDYDLLLAGYLGYISDPEVGLTPLYPNNPVRFVNGDLSDFFKKIDAARGIEENVARLQAYGDAFKFFENQHYFIPVSQERLAVIARKELNLRKDHPHNYEDLSLWGISWE